MYCIHYIKYVYNIFINPEAKINAGRLDHLTNISSKTKSLACWWCCSHCHFILPVIRIIAPQSSQIIWLVEIWSQTYHGWTRVWSIIGDVHLQARNYPSINFKNNGGKLIPPKEAGYCWEKGWCWEIPSSGKVDFVTLLREEGEGRRRKRTKKGPFSLKVY